MLKNVKVSDLIEVLVSIQKQVPLCHIEIDEEKSEIIFRPVRDPNAIMNKTRIQIPKDHKPRLDKDDLDKLVV
jgi:hypothetical protein